jgi:cell division septation protein DedD
MTQGPSPRDEAGRHQWRAPADDTQAPWNPAGPQDEPTHTLVGRRTFWGLLFAATALVIALSAAIWILAGRNKGEIDVPAPGAELAIVRNPGPWKQAPNGPGTEGRMVEGRGQTLFGTGEGVDPGGRIAVENLPEEPVARPEPVAPLPATAAGPAGAAGPAAPPAAPVDLLPPADKASDPPHAALPPAPRASAGAAARAVAQPAPPQAVTSAPASGGTQLQLGAFSSQARAQEAWKLMGQRFSYLGGLAPAIVPTAHDGRTLYRLRTTAPTPAAARDICGRLKVAGEACAIVD